MVRILCVNSWTNYDHELITNNKKTGRYTSACFCFLSGVLVYLVELLQIADLLVTLVKHLLYV